MNIQQLLFKEYQWFLQDNELFIQAELVILFCDIDIMKEHNHYQLLKQYYPNAEVLAISTAGNIIDSSIDTYQGVGIAIKFHTSYMKVFSKTILLDSITDSVQKLISKLDTNGLRHVLFFGPGLMNGSEMLDAIQLPNEVTISGGLAGDGYRFEYTLLRHNENISKNLAIIVGFYGDELEIDIGCETGWQEFGTKRVVTKSYKNIVYEIDHKPAIELYHRYLGDKINDLPNSALRFPLYVKDAKEDKNGVVRVIMKINDDESLVFAGNIKEGSTVQLMRTNVNSILNGAKKSASYIKNNKDSNLVLAISCSARRSVLKQFCEAEIEVIANILPKKSKIIGFYSYGEIAPFSTNISKSIFHNQTMTLTLLHERNI